MTGGVNRDASSAFKRGCSCGWNRSQRDAGQDLDCQRFPIRSKAQAHTGAFEVGQGTTSDCRFMNWRERRESGGRPVCASAHLVCGAASARKGRPTLAPLWCFAHIESSEVLRRTKVLALICLKHWAGGMAASLPTGMSPARVSSWRAGLREQPARSQTFCCTKRPTRLGICSGHDVRLHATGPEDRSSGP